MEEQAVRLPDSGTHEGCPYSPSAARQRWQTVGMFVALADGGRVVPAACAFFAESFLDPDPQTVDLFALHRFGQGFGELHLGDDEQGGQLVAVALEQLPPGTRRGGEQHPGVEGVADALVVAGQLQGLGDVGAHREQLLVARLQLGVEKTGLEAGEAGQVHASARARPAGCARSRRR